MKQTFEDFLMDKHAEQYIGTKDCIVDDSNDWLSNLSSDEFIEYGDMFIKQELEKKVDVGRIELFFDDKTIRVFDSTDAKYKNVNIAGLQAGKLAQEIFKMIKEEL